MRLLDRFTRAAPGMTMAPTYGAVLDTYFGDDKGKRESVGNDYRTFASVGYAGNGVVFSVLQARLRLFTEATFCWRRLDRSGTFTDGSLGLLENPWPNGQTPDLLARMEQHASLAGSAYVHRVTPTILRMLRPDWVDIVSIEMGNEDTENEWCEVVGYLYWEGGRHSGEDPVLLPVDDVAHWAPIPDPLAQWRGMSWLSPIVREVDADLAMVTHRQKFFDNAATPNLLIKYVGPVGAAKLEDLRKQINARHGGADNAWKTMVLDNGADVTVVGNNFRDMTFETIQAAGEVRIASAAGVPPIVAGLQGGLDASTMANYAAAYRNFADSTMHGLWRSACNALEKLMVVPAGAQLWFDTDDIPALRDAEESRQKGHAQLSIAAQNLVSSGYEPDTVIQALVSGDMTLLKHTGLVSVQLMAPGGNGADPTTAESAAVVKQRDVAETIQKIYLGVGTVITADEARQIANKAGADLPIPGPALKPPAPVTPGGTP